MDAISNGSYIGEWVKTDVNTGIGGHYLLKRVKKVNKINWTKEFCFDEKYPIFF